MEVEEGGPRLELELLEADKAFHDEFPIACRRIMCDHCKMALESMERENGNLREAFTTMGRELGRSITELRAERDMLRAELNGLKGR